MISSLRNKKKLTTFSLWFIIAAFVGTIFFVWGVGDKAQEQLYAAKVNGVMITDQEFRQRVEDTRNQFRQLFGNNIDELLEGNSIEKTVMDTLINESLLRGEAEKLGIPASDAEVAAQIQSVQAFQTDGKFDQQLYVQLLGRNRLTPQIFEDSIRRDLTLQKMDDLIRKSVEVSPKEIDLEYVYRNTEASIRYLELSADDFIGGVELTDEALNAFYEENKEAYRVPTKADFKYVAFNAESYKGSFDATDSEIESFFIQNKDAFKEAEKVSAAHILLKVDNWSDEMAANEIYKKAKDIREQLANGADFAALAKKYSQDGTAQTGGELGFFTRGQMVPEFEKAAFETKPGEISDVVKTQFGFHIIKVNEYVPETNPSLDQVRDRIAAMIKDQKAQSSFRTYVFDTYKQILNKSNITAYNADAEEKLEVHEIKGLSAAGDVAPLLGNTNAAARLLVLNKSELSQVMEVGEDKMIFEMTEKYDSYIPELNDIKEQVTADFMKAKSLELAQNTAKEAAQLATMDDAANQLKKSYTTTPKFKRNDPITGLGINQRLMGDIFTSEAGKFIQDAYTVGSKVFLVQVKEIYKPDTSLMSDQEKAEIKAALYGTKSTQAVESYVANLKSKAEIIINQRYTEYYQ
ncbi:MAG: SurA N-terminal domain-containing protein [Deferribacterales bacterium]|jgi:peptidyl-prolyl cis-trans isomerase D